MTKKLTILLKIIIPIVSLALCLSLAELVGPYIFFNKLERQSSAADMYEKYFDQHMDLKLLLYMNCTSDDMYVLDPLFGYAPKIDPDCGNMNSADGFLDNRKLPERRNENGKYVIMLTGGSVADQLGKTLYIEKYLNQKFTPPQGSSFEVINAGVPGWKMPAQFLVTMMYGDRVNGIISLDGFNESFSGTGLKFFYPQLSNYIPFTKMMPLFLRFKIHLSRFLIRSSVYVPSLKNSYLYYISFTQLVEANQKSLASLMNNLNQTSEISLIHKTQGQDGFPEKHALYLKWVKYWLALANSTGANYFHFLQPNALYAKPLADAELSFQNTALNNIMKNLDNEYESQIVKDKLTNAKSLMKIYSKERSVIYKDMVHSKDDQNGYNKGYDMMAQEIVSAIAKKWKLKKKAH